MWKKEQLFIKIQKCKQESVNKECERKNDCLPKSKVWTIVHTPILLTIWKPKWKLFFQFFFFLAFWNLFFNPIGWTTIIFENIVSSTKKTKMMRKKCHGFLKVEKRIYPAWSLERYKGKLPIISYHYYQGSCSTTLPAKQQTNQPPNYLDWSRQKHTEDVYNLMDV